MPENRVIEFTAAELIPLVAEYFGYEVQDVVIDDYTDDEIKNIILDKIL